MWFFGKQKLKPKNPDCKLEQKWIMYSVLLDNTPMVVRLLQNAKDGKADLTFQVGVATPLTCVPQFGGREALFQALRLHNSLSYRHRLA